MIEREVPSLKLAQHMKELGFPQEGIWYWNQSNKLNKYEVHQGPWIPDYWKRIVMAPTIGQMGEWLPTGYFTKRLEGETYWILGWDINKINLDFTSRIEADTRAKCLIHLAEKKLIDVKSLK